MIFNSKSIFIKINRHITRITIWFWWLIRIFWWENHKELIIDFKDIWTFPHISNSWFLIAVFIFKMNSIFTFIEKCFSTVVIFISYFTPNNHGIFSILFFPYFRISGMTIISNKSFLNHGNDLFFIFNIIKMNSITTYNECLWGS